MSAMKVKAKNMLCMNTQSEHEELFCSTSQAALVKWPVNNPDIL